MKTIHLLAVVAFFAIALTACTQDEQLNLIDSEASGFTGVMETLDTRTALTDDNKVLWNPNDRVSIFKKTKDNFMYKVANAAPSGSANFELLGDEQEPTEEVYDANYAIYPYNEANAIANDGSVLAPMPAVYKFKDRASSIENAIMVAKSTETNLTFYNAQSIIRLRLNAKNPQKYGKIQSIKLTSKAHYLSGTAAMTFKDEDTPPSAIITGADAAKELVIEWDESKQDLLPASTTDDFTEFYVPVVPTVFAANDLTMTVVGEKATYTREVNAEISIGRKQIIGLRHTIETDGFTGDTEDGATGDGSDETPSADVWDGTTKEEVTPDNNVYTVTKPSQLAWLSTQTFANGSVTIKLANDIDMGNHEIIAMVVDGTTNSNTTLKFEGDYYTISNVKIISGNNDNGTGQASMFYCRQGATLNVSNLILKNITVTTDENGSGYGAAVIGYCEGTATLTNVDVVNATVIGVKSSGLLVGHKTPDGSLTATNCNLQGTVTLKEYSGEQNGHYAGKYIGTVAGNVTLTGCTVDATVSGNLREDNFGEACGRLYSESYSLTIDGFRYVKSSEGLTTAVASGVTQLYLMDGTYNIENCEGKTLTINGSKKAVIEVHHEGEAGCDYGLDGSTVTFNGVTISTTGNNQTWPNFARMSGTYNDCDFIGAYSPNRIQTFVNCTFTVTGNDPYNSWLYGASQVKFINCTFNTDRKAIYVDGNGDSGTDLTVTNCIFNDYDENDTSLGITDDKAAIETGTTYGKRYSITVTNTIVNGFAINPEGINTGSKLWGNKHSMGTDKLNVVVDGVDVY